MSSDAVARRMTVLFVLAVALIIWRASRVEPLSWPAYQQVTERGEQLFPIAVLADAERRLLHRPGQRTELLRQISVARAADVASRDAAAACDLYARISRSHWRRWPMSRESLAGLGLVAPEAGGEGARGRIGVADLTDDDDQDGHPLDAGELRDVGAGAAPAGVEVEIFCPALEGTPP